MNTCKLDGCSMPQKYMKAGLRPGYYFRYCHQHYVEMIRKGRARGRSNRSIDANGYTIIYVDGNRIPEHRAVMQQKLGRKLLVGESVHHINGIRTDNTPDNLELWLGAIRYGQRAKDIVCPHCSKPYQPF